MCKVTNSTGYSISFFKGITEIPAKEISYDTNTSKDKYVCELTHLWYLSIMSS
jgi:hypothetical protein